jgi:hypothetical protein
MDALILALFSEVAAMRRQIAALEARIEELTRPPKTPENSSKPPSRGQKQDRQPGDDKPVRNDPMRAQQRRLHLWPRRQQAAAEQSR